MAKNLKNNNKIKTGWEIPVKIKDKFVNFCDEKGNKAQEDCAGALFIWCYLPAQVREKARIEAKGIQAVDEKFWEDLSQGLEWGIATQLKIRQQMPEKKKK